MSTDDDANMIRSAFDALYYLQTNPELDLDMETAVYHYLEHGWRQGRNPSAEFSNNWYLTLHSDVKDAGINPLWHYIAAGKAEGRATRSPEVGEHATPVCDPSQHEDVARLALIRTAFSEAHYLAQRPDVAQANIDPVEHYYYTGWREGVNPNNEFDTKYYLESNADVRGAEVNPFWHYLVAGRAESRPGRRPGGYRRAILEAAMEPWQREQSYKTTNGRSLRQSSFQSRIAKLLKQAPTGLAVSISHDCYLSVVGGIQIFISDEQQLFEDRGYDYIHISPATPKLTFRGSTRETFLVRVAVAGQIVGVLRLLDLLVILGSLSEKVTSREFLVHHFFGFGAGDICRLYDAFAPSRSVYWLHDYSSICEGYNLLRNDIALCGAPPENSMSCRVCVYGHGRPAHLRWVQQLFQHCDFEIASPSTFTMDFWKAHSELPYKNISVHPHSHLREDEVGGRRQRVPNQPVRVAFVGFPTASKGWPIFSTLADQLEHDQRYLIYHFAAPQSPSTSSAKFVDAAVTTRSRHAMVELLMEHQIDFVLVGSVWPETFSYVTHEAIAAGCAVLCFEDSGNVRSLVESKRRGQVFANAEALISFFKTGAAINYLGIFSPTTYRIINDGTTATLAVASTEHPVI